MFYASSSNLSAHTLTGEVYGCKCAHERGFMLILFEICSIDVGEKFK
jgi:hypothetical protein